MSAYRIIAARSADMERIVDLAWRIWPEAFKDILPADYIPGMLRDIYAPERLAADISELGHQYWLAISEGSDVGYASAYLSQDRVWIKKLYLLPEMRGRGLGKALIDVARAHYGEQWPVALFVNDGNSQAISFYRSQGFEIEDHVPVRMGPYDFHDYIMVKQ